MVDDDPITQWVGQLRSDETAAAQELWRRYCHRVAGIARKILASSPKGGADEHDVAQSAFRSFFVRARSGSFPQLQDRNDLWRLMATITVRKAIKQKRRQARQPRASDEPALLQAQLREEPTAQSAVILQDEVQRLVGLLDPTAQRVLSLVFAGHTTEEIAAECKLARATIERKRKLIRETWIREAGA